MPPPWRPGDPAVVSRPMHTTEGGAAASVSEPADTPDERLDDQPASTEIVVVGVVALVAGAVLRFSTTSSLWLDEALSVNIARLPAGDLVRWLRHDGHPPLYYLLLHVWTDVFGTGDVAVRALSGVFGLLTLPLAWIAGRRRGGPLLGWVDGHVRGALAVRGAVLRRGPHVLDGDVPGLRRVPPARRRAAPGQRRPAAPRRGRRRGRRAALHPLLGALAARRRRPDRALAGVPRPRRRRQASGVEGRRRPGRRRAAVRALAARRCSTSRPTPAPRGRARCAPPSPRRYTLQDFGSGLYADAAFFAVLLGVFIVLGLFGRGRDGRHIDLDLRTRPQLRVEAAGGGADLRHRHRACRTPPRAPSPRATPR